MVYPIESAMVVDEHLAWNEPEQLPDKRRLKRQRQAYEEAEREDRKNGRSKGIDNAGARKDFL